MSDPINDFQPPPPPPFDHGKEEPTGPTLTAMETITGSFFEPGRVFESFRQRPRFLVAGLLVVLLTAIVSVTLFQRVDMGQYIRDKMDRSSRSAQQTEQQKEIGVKFAKAIWQLFPLLVPIWIAAGAGLYLLGVLAFGGSMSYRKSLAVWVYSALPPAALGTLIAVLVLFLKAPDTIDPEHLLMTNPGAFMGPESSKMLTALLTQFDVLRFYGLFLSAVGLQKVAKLSSASAWSIVLGFWFIGLLLALIGAIFGG
jgi:hypothetical protein